MSKSVNLVLTDELQEFVKQNYGDGTLYATPGEFMRALLREKKERMEAAAVRSAILEGYQDVIANRVVEYKGDLQATLDEAKRREKRGWKK